MKRSKALRRITAALTGGLLVAMVVPVLPAAAAPPGISPQQVFAPDATADAEFGTSVAISGATAIVGAPGDDGGRGAAYILVHRGGAWVPWQKLVAPDGVAGDGFGISVAISGGTALIGAWNDDNYQGSAYVFARNGNTWAVNQKLTAADGAPGDVFGQCVALDGDTALIGAWGDDDLRGAAYVFTSAGGAWTQTAKLTAGVRDPADFFGESVALSGTTALIGEWGDNGMQGAAYIFSPSGGSWIEQAKLIASDGAGLDSFGLSVALDGGTALIGAYGDDTPGGASAGSAYIFAGSGSTWVERAKLVAPDGAASDWFGGSVALRGKTALIGAYGDDGGVGSAYVFDDIGGPWALRAKLVPIAGAADDWFGCSVALSGSNMIVGALWDDTVAGANAGSVWLFPVAATVLP